jgi:hypothetical protein
MHCYVCYWYVFIAVKKSVLRYIFSILDASHPDTLILCEQGCEVPWLFLESERGLRKKVQETLVGLYTISYIFQLS